GGARGQGAGRPGSAGELRPVHARHRATPRGSAPAGDVVARGYRVQEHEHAPVPDAQGARTGGRGAIAFLGAARARAPPRGSRLLSLGRKDRPARRHPRPPRHGACHGSRARCRGRNARAAHLARCLSGSQVRHSLWKGRARLRSGAELRSPLASGVRAAACLAVSTGAALRPHAESLPRLLRSRPDAADAGRGGSRAAPLDFAGGCLAPWNQRQRHDSHVQRPRRDEGARIRHRPRSARHRLDARRLGGAEHSDVGSCPRARRRRRPVRDLFQRPGRIRGWRRRGRGVSPWRKIFAALYDRMMAEAEKAGLSAHRQTLLAGARGRVLEIGGGTGANLPFYPDSVTELVIAEPEAPMAIRLERKLQGYRILTRVVRARAEQLPLEAASFDCAVATLVLCTVTDPARALAEIRRLLKP